MPLCKICQCHIPPFGVYSRERDGLIECLDCHCYCRNTYWKKLDHWKRCPKRQVKDVCFCDHKELVHWFSMDK